jgi:hypothetical protein
VMGTQPKVRGRSISPDAWHRVRRRPFLRFCVMTLGRVACGVANVGRAFCGHNAHPSVGLDLCRRGACIFSRTKVWSGKHARLPCQGMARPSV